MTEPLRAEEASTPALTESEIRAKIAQHYAMIGDYQFKTACMKQDCERAYQSVFNLNKQLLTLLQPPKPTPEVADVQS